MSKAEMMNIEAPFKYFDVPVFPLAKEKASAAKAGVFGSVITGFLLVLFFIGAGRYFSMDYWIRRAFMRDGY